MSATQKTKDTNDNEANVSSTQKPNDTTTITEMVVDQENGHEDDETTPMLKGKVPVSSIEDPVAKPAAAAKRNLNVEAAYLHILGDILNSVGVIIAALLIFFSNGEWVWADPACTYFFSILVVATTSKTFIFCIQCLMETTPFDIDYDGLKSALSKVKNVKKVHDLHIWSLSDGKNCMSVHILIFKEGNA